MFNRHLFRFFYSVAVWPQNKDNLNQLRQTATVHSIMWDQSRTITFILKKGRLNFENLQSWEYLKSSLLGPTKVSVLCSRGVARMCVFQAPCWSSALHLLSGCSHRTAASAAATARLRSASRGSAAFGAEVGRMAEKQRPWTLHRGIPVYHVVKDGSGQPSSPLVSGGHWQPGTPG